METHLRRIGFGLAGDRPCPEILAHISTVRKALRAVHRQLVGERLLAAARAIEGAGASWKQPFDEIVNLFYRSAR